MHLQSTIVMNEAQLSESVHEEIHSRACGADHFGESLLAYVRHHRFRPAFFSEAGQHQERSCQPLFARIEQLIDEICLRAVVSFHEVANKHVGKLVFMVERT